MFNRLDDISRELEFRDPTTRMLLKTYTKAEFDRHEDIYNTVSRAHPSLDFIIAETRQGKDPVESYDNSRAAMATLKAAAAQINQEPTMGNPQLETVKRKLNGLLPLIEMYDALGPTIQGIYVGISRSAKRVIAANNITPQEAFRNTVYRNQILREVFPRRADLEKYYEVNDKLGIETVGALKEFMMLMRDVGALPDDGHEERKIPTREALMALYAAMAPCRKADMDAIYG